jgi:hypothetical protein
LPTIIPEDAQRAGLIKPQGGVIEVHLREVNQLFDVLDPSPFRERDVDPKAEEYIVESIKELPSRKSCRLLIHIDSLSPHSGQESQVAEAIHIHFLRRAAYRRRDLHELIRRGFLSLLIGMAFLAASFLAAELTVRLLKANDLARLMREGFLIVGWVALWRPLEIFLYDWWPILGEQRIFELLSRIDVRIMSPRQ